MLPLQDLKARITRLQELTTGLAEEVCLHKPAGAAVLGGWQQCACLRAVEDALAGAREARNLLAGAVRRMERPCAHGPSRANEGDIPTV
jgi:hypothetical protein